MVQVAGARILQKKELIFVVKNGKDIGCIEKTYEKGLLYVSILTDPTMRIKKFYLCSQMLIAEPNLILVCGRRVIEKTIMKI